MKMPSAFVVGGTGAVGSELVKLLASSNQFDKVRLLGRRTVDGIASSKIEQKVVDFESLEKDGDAFEGVDVGFCSLGTTRRESGADGFYKVDHDYVLNTAKMAKEKGVKQFVLVSSGGSNENSFFLYMKTKGQVEREVGELGFEKFVIVRPGMIEADRGEKSRFVEEVSKVLLKPFKLLSDSLASTATQIAKAMVVSSLDNSSTGKVLMDNAKILKLSKEFDAQQK